MLRGPHCTDNQTAGEGDPDYDEDGHKANTKSVNTRRVQKPDQK